MSKRTNEIYDDFKQALTRLKEAMDQEPTQSNVEIDGTIQRFEFSFELSWKLLKMILKDQGIESNTPRMIIKEAFKAKMIDKGDDWIDMLEDRNKTSHLYDEDEAEIIYKKIKSNHYSLLENLSKKVTKFL